MKTSQEMAEGVRIKDQVVQGDDPEVEPDRREPDPDSSVEDDLRKVTILMRPSVHDDIKRRAKASGVTVSEFIRRAVGLEIYLADEQENGAVVQLRVGDETSRLIIR